MSGGHHVAIIEDEDDIFEALRVTFSLAGWKVSGIKHDFHRAMADWFYEDGVDVLVCDLMLREKVTGVHILTYARDYKPHVFRIVFSGIADKTFNGDVAHLAHVWVQKPNVPQVLAEAEQLVG